MWNCKSVSVVPLVFDQKLNDVGYLDRNTWDLELTAESLLVGNSKGLTKDPRHLRR